MFGVVLTARSGSFFSHFQVELVILTIAYVDVPVGGRNRATEGC